MRINNYSRLTPFIKWPGGKSAELDVIFKQSPKEFDRFFDPFLGGGSVLLAIPSNVQRYANDYCYELVELFRIVTHKLNPDLDRLISLLKMWSSLSIPKAQVEQVIKSFELDEIFVPKLEFDFNSEFPEIHDLLVKVISRFSKDLRAKLLRTSKLQLSKGKLLSNVDLERTIQGVLKGSFYYSVRDEYNFKRTRNIKDSWRVSYFYILRELAYAAMFRFNSNDEFNVPYGGISYNDKDLTQKIEHFLDGEKSHKLSNIDFFNEDYKAFLARFEFTENDFIFVDPPYDTEFSSYDNKLFAEREQRELSEYLRRVKAKVMVLIGESPLITELYSDSHWNIITNDKNYVWNIKSRNDGKTKHLLIRNYLE